MKKVDESIIVAMAAANQIREPYPESEMVTIPFEAVRSAFKHLIAASVQYGEDAHHARNSSKILKMSAAHHNALNVAMELVTSIAWSRPDLIRRLSDEVGK